VPDREERLERQGLATSHTRLTLLNEAGTHVGTTLDVTRTAQELADIVVPRLADLAVIDLLDAVLSGDEPRPGPLAGTIALRRVAHQSIFGGVPEAVVEPGDVDIHPESFPSARCLATGKTVLTGADDPTFIWSTGHNPARAATIRKFGIHSVLSVPIRARGVTLGVAVFLRGQRPEPFERDDVHRRPRPRSGSGRPRWVRLRSRGSG
jgi:GAF domain-containing protein